MAYPARSNFSSAEPGSAWWIVNASNGRIVCRTEGFIFIVTLQRRLVATTPARASGYDGTRVSPADISVDGNWGPMTQRALYASLRARGASQLLLDSVRDDGNARRISTRSLAAAIWLMHRDAIGDAAGNAPTSTLALSSDVIPPLWGSVPPIPTDGAGAILCTTASDSTPAGPTVPIPEGPPAAPEVIPPPSQAGPLVPVPPGQEPAPPAPAAGSVSPVFLATALGSLALVGGMIWVLTRDAGPKRSPALAVTRRTGGVSTPRRRR